MRESSDRELVQEAQRGDVAAIGALYSRYWRGARAVAFAVTRDLPSAEDAASEAFQQALTGLGSVRDPDRFGAWLRTIVVRRARLARCRRHCPIDSVAETLTDGRERPDETLGRLELHSLAQQALGDLSLPLREAIALVYFEGYDPACAARFLNIAPGTLRRRLHDGRAGLRASVESILRGRNHMREEREQLIRRFEFMINNGEIYAALRAALALRRPSRELVEMLLLRQPPSPPGEFTRETLLPFLRPSGHASDPEHPVGFIADAVRRTLPEFRAWNLDPRTAPGRFFAPGESTLPPGFLNGSPGAFLRTSRALLRVGDRGCAESMYEILQSCKEEQTFRGTHNELRLSDTLDLTWMTAISLELRSVQELLERLCGAILPQASIRFSAYDEPRYRSALQLHIGNDSRRAACGGVLGDWRGRPDGVGAAHVRIYLEPWATLLSGRLIEFDRLPELPGAIHLH